MTCDETDVGKELSYILFQCFYICGIFFLKQQGLGRFDFWNGFEPEWDNKTHSTDLLNAKAIKLGPIFL